LLRERTNFAALDFASRDQYRTEIEELAKRSGKSEYFVAEKATELAGYALRPGASQGDDPATENVDIGFFLVGSRRLELEEAIGFRPGFGLRLKRAFRQAGWLGIVLPVFLHTVLLMW